jgi:hypothetical protein
VPAENANELLVFIDRFKLIHKISTIVTISEKNGAFAIASSDIEFAQNTFNIMKTAVNARGGGKPTIRGSIPRDKINQVIDALKEAYSRK